MTLTPETSHLLRDVAATAAAIDAGTETPRVHLNKLGELGLLNTELAPSAALISDLAGQCMSTAFSLWAHRVVLEYFRLGQRSAESEQVFAELAAGQRPGSTAMASGLKWLAGVGEIAVEAQPEGEGWHLKGFITWASNLFDDTIVVLPARQGTQTLVAWVYASELGITPVTGLLALNGTASGNLSVDTTISADRILSTDLPSFAQQFRPLFLLLQTAFCVGLIHRSLTESETALDRAENAVFSSALEQLIDRAQQHRQRWAALVDSPEAELADYLTIRLEAAQLAAEATRLESTLAGGRGYQANSETSRRFREAAFLPVQSPSEGQLKWELRSQS